VNIWVIGNGESRRTFALNQIKDLTIGCNAVHRDFICDKFVAVDRRMVEEILRNDAVTNSAVYTRQDWYKEWCNDRVRSLPDLPFEGADKVDKPFHWNSGPYAILLASMMLPQHIHLLGFDLWSVDGLVNNFYKDTSNYSNANSKKVMPDFWIYQLAKVFNHYSQIEFIQHQKQDWRIPDSWLAIKNLTIVYDIV
jgi:hypothetical protein